MNLKKRTLSTEIECYPEIWNIKKNLKAFQNIVAIFKFNSILFFLYSIFLDNFLLIAYCFFLIHQLLSFIQLCICIVLLCYKNKKKKKTFSTLFIHASNPWWWPIKGPKVLGTILVNSSTNFNLKPRHLSGNLKGS